MNEFAETAYAKLNLALHVRERMANGYHRIETLFVFCEDGDHLTGDLADDLTIELAGPFAGKLEGDENLALRAATSLRRASETSDGARLRLTKTLPVSSGIGGGSADAAATLRLLNRLWRLDWSIERLDEIARQLGADVPACLRSMPTRGEGRGDDLNPVEVDLSGTPTLLINPRAPLSTTEVFERWGGVDHGPLVNWRDGRNDLQDPAEKLVPQIHTVLSWLSAQRGIECARMSGSGATCFALFQSDAERDEAAIAVPREWWRLATRLR